MSIDKNSSGLPEVNLARRTTKVNVWMVVGILLFLGGAAVLAYSHWRKSAASKSAPAAASPAEPPQR